MTNLLKFFGVILSIFLGLTCKKDQVYGDAPEYSPAQLFRADTAIIQNSLGYYIGLPARYNSNPNKSYPLIVCFPGGGVLGDTKEKLDLVTTYGVPELIKKQKFPPVFQLNEHKYSFIVFAPHFIEEPDPNETAQFLTFIKSRYRIDTTRVYLIGVSIGGRMASDFASNFPEQVTSVAIMSGCSDSDIDAKAKTLSEANIPVWAFHNRADSAWPISTQERFISAVNDNAPARPAMLTIFEQAEGDLGHDAWTRATNPTVKFQNKNIYEWMLGYSK